MKPGPGAAPCHCCPSHSHLVLFYHWSFSPDDKRNLPDTLQSHGVRKLQCAGNDIQHMQSYTRYLFLSQLVPILHFKFIRFYYESFHLVFTARRVFPAVQITDNMERLSEPHFNGVFLREPSLTSRRFAERCGRTFKMSEAD